MKQITIHGCHECPNARRVGGGFSRTPVHSVCTVSQPTEQPARRLRDTDLPANALPAEGYPSWCSLDDHKPQRRTLRESDYSSLRSVK